MHAPGKCRKCEQVGHNKSCKNDPTNETTPPSQTVGGPSSLRRKIMVTSFYYKLLFSSRFSLCT